MHALREFIQERMDARRWQPADLSRESGLSLQLVSQLLNDDRDAIANPPKSSTVKGLARAFRVDEASVMRAAFAAMGYELDAAHAVDLSSVPSEQLLQALADRLGVSREESGRGKAAPIAEDEMQPRSRLSRARPERIDPAPPTAEELVDDPHYAKAAQPAGSKTKANRARRRAEKDAIPGEEQAPASEGDV